MLPSPRLAARWSANGRFLFAGAHFSWVGSESAVAALASVALLPVAVLLAAIIPTSSTKTVVVSSGRTKLTVEARAGYEYTLECIDQHAPNPALVFRESRR